MKWEILILISGSKAHTALCDKNVIYTEQHDKSEIKQIMSTLKIIFKFSSRYHHIFPYVYH